MRGMEAVETYPLPPIQAEAGGKYLNGGLLLPSDLLADPLLTEPNRKPEGEEVPKGQPPRVREEQKIDLGLEEGNKPRITRLQR